MMREHRVKKSRLGASATEASSRTAGRVLMHVNDLKERGRLASLVFAVEYRSDDVSLPTVPVDDFGRPVYG